MQRHPYIFQLWRKRRKTFSDFYINVYFSRGNHSKKTYFCNISRTFCGSLPSLNFPWNDPHIRTLFHNHTPSSIHLMRAQNCWFPPLRTIVWPCMTLWILLLFSCCIQSGMTVNEREGIFKAMRGSTLMDPDGCILPSDSDSISEHQY